ncbi:MAG: hypothetical protein P1V36_04565, partial [Planctomycetota bacterium]|nr:hypothetical protein [Planctomycetota bacterium]
DAQASRAERTPGPGSGAPGPSPARAGALRRLGLFPASSLPGDRLVTVVARAGEATAIETFAGAGIYHQELLRRVGPYVVLRARRP